MKKYYLVALVTLFGLINSFIYSQTGFTCDNPINIATLPYQTNDNTANYGDTNDIQQNLSCAPTYPNTNYSAGNDVFYSYLATESGLISFKLTPTGPNSSIFIYGTCPTEQNISCLAGSVDYNSNKQVSYINDFPVTAGNTYIIVISSGPSVQTFGYTLTVQKENCSPPIGLIPASTDVTKTTANLVWTNPTGATSWKVAVQPFGSSVPSGGGVTVSSNSYMATGLMPETKYQYFVQSECVPGVFSSWAGPYEFSTKICDNEDQCNFVFKMTSSSNSGWNGATMQVIQSGTVVQTIGSNFINGTGPVNITVPLCKNIPFELLWNKAGSLPHLCAVQIINSFGQTLFTKAEGTGAAGQVLFSNNVNCDSPNCDISPNSLSASAITTTGANLSWGIAGLTPVDIYIVSTDSPAPISSTPPTYSSITSNSFSINNLAASTAYTFYVRFACSPVPSPWSIPFKFTTAICDEAFACSYVFKMTDSYGDGWTGATMQIRQNGVVVQTIGSTFTSGKGPVSVSVPLCKDIPFDLYWNNLGSHPNECVVEIINSFGQSLYTKAAGIGSAGQVLYNNSVKCDSPVCLPPVSLLTTDITANGATLSWGAVTNPVDIYIVPTGSPAPTISTMPTHTGITVNSIVLNNLQASTSYTFYVRSNCSPNTSVWSAPFTFATLLCNSEDKCNYVFKMTDSYGNGWNGATMQVRQNGIIVQTIGSTFTSGKGPVSVLIPLCKNAPFDIYWAVAGTQPSQCEISVENPFGQALFTKVAGTGAAGQIVYNNTVNCESPVCSIPPGSLSTLSVNANGATLTWGTGATTSSDIYIVTAGTAAPTSLTIPTYSGINSSSFIISDLLASTSYTFYVRFNCSPSPSAWSAPYTFSTPLCNQTEKCNYIFKMSDYSNNGWNGATMQVRQNGIVVQTIGSTYTSGAGPVLVSVPLCKNIPFDLYWNYAGNYPNECIVSVINPFGQTLYTKGAGVGTVGQVVYTNVVNCDAPVCDIIPSTLSATAIKTNGAILNWGGTATSVADVYIVTTGLSAPDNLTIPTYSGITASSLELSNLLSGTSYTFYVRFNCSSSPSAWSAPFIFTTLICDEADKCSYVFKMTDSYGDGWNGATMQIRQNGVVVQIIGSTFTSGKGPVSVSVPLCKDVPFDLYWNNLGSHPNECVVEILNSFGQSLYIKASGTGTVGQILYSNIVKCETPACDISPVSLSATAITKNGATLNWEAPLTTSWDVYIVPTNSLAPTASTIPTYTGVTTNPLVLSNLSLQTSYTFYVRVACSSSPSAWSSPCTFTTSLCDEAQTCNYVFKMTDSAGNGWDGAIMQVRQNGKVIQTIGSTFTSGAGPVTVSVPLCNNEPFDLFWNYSGNSPNECAVTVINSFGQTLYTKAAGEGMFEQVLYNNIVNCDSPVCDILPASLSATNITKTGVKLNWATAVTSAVDIYVVPVGLPAPNDLTTPTYKGITANYLEINNLQEGTSYAFYVRFVCSPSLSAWSEPFTFTTVCDSADKCVYLFTMTSNSNLGWDGSTMQVRQNGNVIQTIGSTFTSGSGPVTISIPLCNNVPFELYWDKLGNTNYGCNVSVKNSFGQTLYTKESGTGLVGQVLYSNVVKCDTPTCEITPISLYATTITNDSATLNWNALATTAWDVYVVPTGSPSPIASTIPTYSGISSNPFTISNLLSDSSYTFYVRATCSATTSLWSLPFTFTTSICNSAEKCNYIFKMSNPYSYDSSSSSQGWNGATMYVRQNGKIIQTIGPTFTSGKGPVSVSVPLCKNTPFDLNWVGKGNYPNDCVLEIINSFGQTMYKKEAGVGSTGQVLYNNVVNCDTPACDGIPSSLTATTITTYGATLSWQSLATPVSWDVYIVPSTSLPPTASTIPTYAAVTNNSLVVSNLLPLASYNYYVRTNCASSKSAWSEKFGFTTLKCDAVNKCNYTFKLTSSGGNGWGDTRMQVRQNGEVIQTLGTTFTSGYGPISISVPLCKNVPFDIYVNNMGSSIYNCGIEVKNPFGQTLFAKDSFAGFYGEGVVYSNVANCNTPVCDISPVSLSASAITMTGATLSWNAPATNTWDVYIVPTGSTAPTVSTTPTYAGVKTKPMTIDSLSPQTSYTFYVRVPCSPSPSAWSTPYTFTTSNCEIADKCNYIFKMTSTNSVFGWGNNTMQVRQNGVVVKTIGSTFTSGFGPENISVSLCKNVPFDLYWDNSNNASQFCAVEIINSFGQTLYTKAAGTGTAGQVLYSNVVKCDAPACDVLITSLSATAISTNGAILNWGTQGTTVWDVYVVPSGSPEPTASTTPTYSEVTSRPFTINNLSPGIEYAFYVRGTCSPMAPNWSAPYTFTTLCDDADKCNYVFKMTDYWGDGWNGATIKIRQNGVVVQTIGSTFTSGNGPVSVSVPLCKNAAFDFYMDNPGTSPSECGIEVLNSFGQTLFSENYLSGENYILYTDVVKCDAPLCYPQPITISATNITTTGATLNWTTTQAASWDFYIVPKGTPAPTALTTPDYTNISANNLSLNNLLPHTIYDVYARVNCSLSSSVWSAPFSFNTLICDDADKCVYVFNMYNYNGNGWAGARLQVQQSGIVVGTIGSTFTDGYGPVGVSIPLCKDIPFDLIWTDGGGSPNQSYVEVFNSFGQKLFGRFPSTGVIGSAVSCNTPVCDIVPTSLTVSAITANSAELTWVSPGNITWDIYVVPSGSPAPTALTIPTYEGVNAKPYIISNLLPDTSYVFYVRVNCSSPSAAWSSPRTFTTLISCQVPTISNVKLVNQTTVTIGWTENPTQGATQWEVYLVPQGIGKPLNETAVSGEVPYYIVNSNPCTITGLEPNTKYCFNVRALCSDTDISDWSWTGCFITKPINDECDASIEVPVNSDLVSTYKVIGNTKGATSSMPLPSPACNGYPNNDIWFSFIATEKTHIISIDNINGTVNYFDLKYILYSGNDCGSLSQMYCSDYSNDYTSVAKNLIPGNTYMIRVYSLYSDDYDYVSFDVSITTPPPVLNDECTSAIALTVNDDLEPNNKASGSFPNATPSSEIISCNNKITDDVWYRFVASSSRHRIVLSEVTATSGLGLAVYKGECGSLVQKYCSLSVLGSSEVVNYEVGETYFIRVFSIYAMTQPTSFKIHVGTVVTDITSSVTQYSTEELVKNVLIDNPCVSVSNVTSSTGINFGSVNGIGSFTNPNKSLLFPITSGVVLSTGNALSVPGPKKDLLSEGSDAWGGDSELEAIISNTGQTMVSKNASKLEFDFTSINEFMSFNFLFASDEYVYRQCTSSDAFAFLLTDLTTNVTTNLAVLPGTNVPVSVVTIREKSLYGGDCDSSNLAYFAEKYYYADNTTDPVNFNGFTKLMTASSPIIPNHPYHVKLVIADRGDTGYDSVVFIQRSSFTSGPPECMDKIKLVAFIDANSNGIKDSGEDNFSHGSFMVQKNNTGAPTVISAPDGNYTLYGDNPINTYDFAFQLNQEYANYYSVVATNFNDINIPAGSGTQTLYFPLTVTQNYKDVSVTIIPMSEPVPGATYVNRIVYTNSGTLAASGTLTFTKPNVTTITDISQPGTTPQSDGFVYDFINLAPNETRTIDVTLSIPNTVNIDDILTGSATISANAAKNAGGIGTTDMFVNSQKVVASYSNTELTEAHTEKIPFSSFATDEYLTYTIRFQNTGTVNAVSVKIEDVLNTKFDLESLRMISASHPYVMERNGNKMVWHLDYINLVGAPQSDILSRGYVTFKVKLLPGFEAGDIIPNSTDIYFDNSDAFPTNIHNTEFTEELKIVTFDSGNILMYPNPTSDVVQIRLQNSHEILDSLVIYDLLGKIIKTVNGISANQSDISVGSLAQGMYLLEITTQSKLKTTKKLIVE